MAIQFQYNDTKTNIGSNVAYARINKTDNINGNGVYISIDIYTDKDTRDDPNCTYFITKNFIVNKYSDENKTTINPDWTLLHSGDITAKSYEYLMQQTEFFKNPIEV
jgi:hypothetical protein